MTDIKESDTAHRILELAVDAIDRHGESGLRISELVEKSKCSTSSIYHFFESREGLVVAAQEERYARGFRVDLDDMAPRLVQLETRDEAIAAVRQLMMAFFDPTRAQRRLQRLNALASAYRRPELAHRLGENQVGLIELMTKVFLPWQERGWLRPDLCPTTTVAWILGNALSRSFIEIVDIGVDPQGWNELAVEMTLRALFGELPTTS